MNYLAYLYRIPFLVVLTIRILIPNINISDSLDIANIIRTPSHSLVSSISNNSVASPLAYSSKKNIYSFNNISELKAANISVNSTATTKGFNIPGDNGGAKYTISDSPIYPIETNISIALDNGLFANLNFTQKSIINVESLGIPENRFISNTLNLVLPHLSGKVAGIKFSDGMYYVNSPIIIPSINFYGSDTSAIVIDSHYASDCFACIRTDTNVSNELGFYNIHIIANIDNQFVRKQETALLYFRNIAKCTIKNCTFEANESSSINSFIPIILLWFQSDNISNVSIANSYFTNNTGVNIHQDDSTLLSGGCLWISGETPDAHISNIYINHCDFLNTVIDEHVAMWKGQFNGINMQNCAFSNHSSQKSNNFLSFYYGAFNEINLSNINMEIQSTTMYPIKFTDFISDSNFTINDLNIMFNFDEISNPNTHSFSVIYIDEDKHVDSDVNVLITLRNSKFIADSDLVMYRSLVQCKNTSNKSIRIDNCYTNMSCTQQILNIAPDNNINAINSPTFK